MAQFEAIHPDIEVNGYTVLSIIYGMGRAQTLGLRILAQNGIFNPQPEKWYPQQAWLNAFREISERIGPHTLYFIGGSIPDYALFPPGIDDLQKALSAIDIAFHMNHRLHDKVLYDQSTGALAEGIGNYIYKKIDLHTAEIVCNNSYPCDFDRGVIDAVVHKYKPSDCRTTIHHDQTLECRNQGGDACKYIVAWEKY